MPIPAGHEIHHICHNRSCVNPAHMKMLSRRAHIAEHQPSPDLTHPPAGDCRHGHDWGTNGRLNSQHTWICKACSRMAWKRADTKRRARP